METDSFPYPNQEESQSINEAIQHLFDVIQQKETEDGNVALFSAVTEAKESTTTQKKAAQKIVDFLSKIVGKNRIVIDAKAYAEKLREVMGERSNPLVASAKRTVNSISEAQKAIAHLAGKPLTNKKLGITATLSKNTIGKLGTLKKGEDARLHALAVANVDRLFENAQFDVTHPHKVEDRNIEQIHRLGSLMIDPETGEYVPVMVTVKELNNPKGNRIYSVEADD